MVFGYFNIVLDKNKYESRRTWGTPPPLNLANLGRCARVADMGSDELLALESHGNGRGAIHLLGFTQLGANERIRVEKHLFASECDMSTADGAHTFLSAVS